MKTEYTSRILLSLHHILTVYVTKQQYIITNMLQYYMYMTYSPYNGAFMDTGIFSFPEY